MTLQMVPGGRVPVAEVDGRLDLRSAPDLGPQLTAALAEGAGSLVVDLSAVDFIDSSGLSVLVVLHREAERRGGRLAVVPPCGPAGQIFALTRSERFFHLVHSGEADRDGLVAASSTPSSGDLM